jgi:hypothetical protein
VSEPESLPRDAHLAQALRHAPDHDAAPPPAVRARILAQARAAAAQRSARPRWLQYAAALGSWRVPPQRAAAFGSVAVAALVGLLWSTQEPPVRTSEPASPAPAASAPATAEQPTPAAPTVAPAPARKAAPPAALPMPPSRVERRPSQAPAPPAADTAARSAGAHAEPAAERDAAPREAAAADRARLDESRLRAPAAPQAASDLGRLALRAERSRAPVEPLLDRPATGFAWQAAGRTFPHGDAQREWWAALRAAMRGRWTRADAPPPAGAPWLVLTDDGRPFVTLWTFEGALWLRDDAAGTLWQAPADARQLRAWEEAAAGWGR